MTTIKDVEDTIEECQKVLSNVATLRPKNLRADKVAEELEAQVTGYRNDPTPAEKSDAKRIADRMKQLNIDVMADVEDIEDEYGSRLDSIPYSVDDEAFDPRDGHYRQSFAQDEIAVVKDVVQRCQKTEDAVQTFIRDTEHLTDLPAAAEMVGEVSMMAHGFKLQMQCVLKQMELTNEKKD